MIRNFLTGILRPRNLLRSFLRRFEPTRAERLEAALSKRDGVFFIQVGANDGLTSDPIRNLILKHRSWKGICIEPVPYLFDRLKQNYAHRDGLIFENVAVSATAGVQPFYHVSVGAGDALGLPLPHWFEGLGSFSREHVAKHMDGVLNDYIVESLVTVATMSEVLDRHQVRRIDLIQVDTEGHDYEVIKLIDLQKYRPTVVHFEHAHLSAQDRAQLYSRLRAAGFKLHIYEYDTLALKSSPAVQLQWWLAKLLRRAKLWDHEYRSEA